VVAGEMQVSDESFEVRFFVAKEVNALPMVDSIRLRVDDFRSASRPALR